MHKRFQAHKPHAAFTIVELLIVIVIIGILAAIVVVAYNGVQKRARDSRRLSDMSAIVKALEVYKAQEGGYPMQTLNGIAGSWEQSNNQPSDVFMEYLAGYGFGKEAPRDPVNNVTTVDSMTEKAAGRSGYFYYRYTAGSYGCDSARGRYYVLGVTSFESQSGTVPQSPGFSCSGRNWQDSFAWVTGGYER